MIKIAIVTKNLEKNGKRAAPGPSPKPSFPDAEDGGKAQPSKKAVLFPHISPSGLDYPPRLAYTETAYGQ